MPEHDLDTRSRAELVRELGRLVLESERDGDTHALALSGELDIASVPAVQEELERIEATDAGAILVDLSGIRFIDSTGLRLLLMAQARSRADSDRLVLLRPPEHVMRVVTLAGVADRLPFAD